MNILNLKPTRIAALMLGTALILAAAPTQYADAAVATVTFDIPSQSLSSALSEYARQSSRQILFSPNIAEGKKAPAVTGAKQPLEALEMLLRGSGLDYQVTDTGAVLIARTPAQTPMNLKLAAAGPTQTGIEEVLVTARKREEAVENIPISITALSSEDLKTFGVRNFADLEGVVPGLNMGGGGNGVKKDGNPYIRGVGQRETKVTLDPAVATYIDGIYIGRAAGALLDIVDVDNIQVLRGPQGTLFGKNATGGAISVTLKKPTNNWEGEVSANIGNYGRRDLTGTLNVPFVEDMLSGRLSIASINSNGYFTNIRDNTKWGGDNRVSGIAQLRYLPTDNLTIDLLGERTRIRETPRPQKCSVIREIRSGVGGFSPPQMFAFNNNSLATGGLTFGQYCAENSALPQSQFASDYTVSGNLQSQGRYWVDSSTASLTVNWDVGNIGPVADLSVKSISAWRKVGQIADEDLDAVGALVLMRTQPEFTYTTQKSQELTLSGKTFHDRLFLSTGFYFFKEETPSDVLLLSAGISQGAQNTTTGQVQTSLYETTKEKLETDNKAYAWFAQADFDLTSQIELSAGIRWTEEKRWSRYSKQVLDARTAVYGLISGYNLNGQTVITGTVPGYQPLSNWRFGTCGPTYPLAGCVFIGAADPSDWRGNDVYAGDELSTTDDGWTPMVSAKYHLHDRFLTRLHLDSAMFYATYSVGFHSGGVTAGAADRYPDYDGVADPITFKPEKVQNYEVGTKLTALDRRIQTNISAFFMNYTDMQLTSTAIRVGIPIPSVENVGKSVIKGVEAEITLLPTPNWRITASGSYTDADIREWLSPQRPLDPVFGNVLTNRFAYDLDRSDEPMPRVPRWQAFAATQYTINLPGGGTLTPSVAARFTSSIYHGFDRGSFVYTHGGYYYNHGGDTPPTGNPMSALCTRPVPAATCTWRGATSNPQSDPFITPDPDAKWKTRSRPTTFFDARMTWNSADGKIEAALWGKNLFNIDDYLVGGIPLADVTGATGQVFANPRTFGLNVTYHFAE